MGVIEHDKNMMEKWRVDPMIHMSFGKHDVINLSKMINFFLLASKHKKLGLDIIEGEILSEKYPD